MARIAGVDLPKDKRIEIGLTYVYGIGRTSANKILEATGINPDTRVKDLTEEEEAKLRECIDNPHHGVVYISVPVERKPHFSEYQHKWRAYPEKRYNVFLRQTECLASRGRHHGIKCYVVSLTYQLFAHIEQM